MADFGMHERVRERAALSRRLLLQAAAGAGLAAGLGSLRLGRAMGPTTFLRSISTGSTSSRARAGSRTSDRASRLPRAR